MKSRTAWKPGTDEHDIWLWHDGPNDSVTVVGPDLRTMTVIERGGIMPATLTVPSRVLDALAEALMDRHTPRRATVRHLDDAVRTRDRLLTLVERLTAPEAPEGGSDA